MFDLFAIWKNSHFDTRFYRQMYRFSMWKIALYLIVFYTLFALVRTLVFTTRTLPQWQQAWQQTQAAITQSWPENTKLSYKNNQLAFEPASQPALYLPFHQPTAQKYHLPSNLAYIDPHLDPNQSSTPAALLIFGSDQWWIKRNDIQPQAYPYQELLGFADELSIDQDWWQNQAGWSNVQAELVPSLTSLSLIWFGWLRLFTRIFIVAIFCWLSQPLLWFLGQPLRFKATFQRGLFLLPLTEEIYLLLFILYPNQQSVSFWLIWFLAFLIVAWNNRAKLVRQV